ncbi:MAG: DUF1080 domain-containing protein [Planctomycetota bacterium]|nr:DUF1080 domain-containing protein [Planctomycetota bacterium]
MRLLALLLLAPGIRAQVPEAPPERIPVLLITGVNNHDWEWTSRSLETILDESGRFDVIVTREPAKTLAHAPALKPFRVFVLDYYGPRWGEPAETNFLQAVRGGVGVVVIHAANNPFENWIEYEKLVALCWRRGTGHGRFHAFDVRAIDRNHPITRTLPDLRAHPDELYHDLVPMHGTDYRVLGVAHSSKESGGTGDDEPMIVVKSYGRGRVFHTPLGHVWPGVEKTRASHLDPQFQSLVVRGTEWAATGAVVDGIARPNELEDWDVKAGWRLLFDGETTDGWTSHGGDAFPERGWSVESGCLRHVHGAGGGDIVTTELFEDFELEFEWKVAAHANSGVKYRVPESETRRGMLGPEYQILDAAVGVDAKHESGSLYDVIAPAGRSLAPVGRFNHSRIVVRGDAIEHWLNGRKVVDATIGSAPWREAIAASKFAQTPEFATPKRGHIGFQDHGDEVWFRSIKLRDLANLPGSEVTIFDGDTLAGWRELGDARWSALDGEILGEFDGGGQSFLVTEATYADFILELELRNEAPGNSGIQVRSKIADRGHLYGYQIEVDPSARAWSGGLYDEARRGWLQTLQHNELGREAFRPGEWNHYRIECVGPSIRAWVNGVPTADFIDHADAEGVIGLQVHGGNDTRMRWRNLRLRVL